MMESKRMLERLAALAKTVGFRSGLIKTRYGMLLTPLELLELMGAIVKGEKLSGEVVEVGVARGKTTVFVNTLLDELGSQKKYFAIDTFSGFEPSDVDYEKNKRGKGFSFVGFRYNDVRIWKRVVVDLNSFSRIKIIASDIKQVEFADDVRFSTALIDVDLYKPTLAALEKIYPRMTPGGSIIVDDVVWDTPWDGSRVAFQEFVEKSSITSWEWIGDKGAVIHC